MRNIGLRKTLLALGCVTACVPAAATAQTTGPNKTNKAFVHDLFFEGTVVPQEPAALVEQIASDSANAVAKFVGVALSSAPVASSSAGFSYVRNATTGELSLKSDSFGPTFAERPLTNGARVWSFGVSFQHSSISFDGGFGTPDGQTVGLPLIDNNFRYGGSNGYLQFNNYRAYLQSRSEALNFAFSYGVTDRLDVGIAVPIVSLTLTGRKEISWDVTAQFNAGGAPQYPTPTGANPIATTNPPSQSTSGIGDTTLRFKYSLASWKDDGVGVVADVRLPTGDADNLLGAGKASVKTLLVFSKSGLGPASIHANAGYTAGGLSDEVNYVVGTDVALLQRKQLTASISMLGRTLRDAALPIRRRTVESNSNGTPGVSNIVVDRFIWPEGTLSLMQLAAGIKFHVGGQWLVNAAVVSCCRSTSGDSSQRCLRWWDWNTHWGSVTI